MKTTISMHMSAFVRCEKREGNKQTIILLDDDEIEENGSKSRGDKTRDWLALKKGEGRDRTVVLKGRNTL